MKFSCGLTEEAKKQKLSNWHNFLVLWPRSIGAKDGKYECVIFETVERRGIYYSRYDDTPYRWEYRRKSK